MRLLRDISAIFSAIFLSRLVFLHIGAFVVTALLVVSGLDYFYATVIQEIPPALNLAGVIAYPIGMLLPVLLMSGMGVYVMKTGNTRVRRLLYVFFLALMMAVFFQSMYKGITGRVSPSCNVISESGNETCLDDRNFAADSFHFGFIEKGILFGWPSGHSTSAFALGVLFFLVFRGPLRFAGILFAGYTLIGVSFEGHWLSDALAGSLIGTSIAFSVHRVYRSPPSLRATTEG